MTTDAAGNVLIALYGAHRLVVLADRTGRSYGQPMTAGRVYLIAGDGAFGLSGFGGPAVKAAVTATYLAVDHHGNIVISDNPDSCLAVVAARTGTFFGQKMTAGHIYRIAGRGRRGLGDGGPARQAEFTYPTDVAVAKTGAVYFADAYRVRVISP